MTRFDVFNGDADGICSLHQLRLAEPVQSVLVTGVKRDIALLSRVDARAGDRVTVLDVSADVNRAALASLLERGVRIDYFDHHYAGDLPAHANLRVHLDPSAQMCTGLIVDRYLGGAQRIWAVVAAFGDDLAGPANALAPTLGLPDEKTRRLRELGELLAYNAYADSEADLIVHPAELYRLVSAYADPFAFVDEAPVCRTIARQRQADFDMTQMLQPEFAFHGATVYILPDEAWTRRIRGTLANDLANRYGHLAHAVLTPNAEGGYTVSVRAPKSLPAGADALCRKFATGGGRVGAAGINNLPRDQLRAFVRAVDAAFP